MAFDLFGFTFGKMGTVPDQVDSFAPKTIEDGEDDSLAMLLF